MPSSATALRALHSSPTRRSSDLGRGIRHGRSPHHARDLDPSLRQGGAAGGDRRQHVPVPLPARPPARPPYRRYAGHQFHRADGGRDRKSTRLNSSHLVISYAVFCHRPPRPTLFPYTTLFRSGTRYSPWAISPPRARSRSFATARRRRRRRSATTCTCTTTRSTSCATSISSIRRAPIPSSGWRKRSEEHTSELQSPCNLVCRLLPPPSAPYTLPLHDALPIWDEVFAMGDLPTTRAISILRYGKAAPPEAIGDNMYLYHYPLDLLRDLHIVDTPGTNSIERMEEEIGRAHV